MISLVKKFCALAVLSQILFSSAETFAATQVIPTTTLAAETGNNTSTSPTFAGSTNGNLPGKNNISKVSATTLLYPGSATKVYAHFMAWFGGTNHLNVGYASDDPAQVTRQVNDMLSRGLSGAIIDWYGPDHTVVNNASLYLKQEAEKHSNFDFAITEDVGALKTCANTAGCDVTGRMIKDLVYAYNTFEQSPAYMRVGTRPLVFFFGVDAYTLDWTRVRNGVPGNPIFIFRNNSGFTHSQTGGAFSWTGLSSDPNNMGLGYLDSFYSTGNKYPSLQSVGSSYKGFDDSIASWGSKRLLNQQCGQTWLNTIAETGKYFSTSNQLAWMQLVTWNDYEEGTALETGIDNCVSIAITVAGKTLSWALNGQSNTVDHFQIFISLDGVNLMRLATVATSARALDLSTFSLAPGTYKLFVQAVGKPFLTNKMSGAASYSVANTPPTISLSATPTTGAAILLVSASTAGSKDPDGTLASSRLDFGDGTVLSAASGSHNYSKSGTYVLKATVTDNLGASSSTSATITVKPPTLVTISSPLNNATVGRNVTVSGKATSSVTISLMQIYLDGAKSYQIAGSSVSKSLSLSAGTHRITIQSVDINGALAKSTINVTAK